MQRTPIAACLVALASTCFASGGGPKLGYLGQTSASTRIYASPNSHSRIFSRVGPSQYLVIKPAPKAGWYAVLLQEGIYGFVPSKSVKQLPYEVRSRNSSGRNEYAMNQADPASRSGVVSLAEQYIGRTPYKWGGNDVYSGIDCSGFVKEMYGKIGVDLPRTAYAQSFVGQPIYRLEDLRAGDRLYFWDYKRGMIGHTGIYKGNGYFVHSSHGRGGVGEDFLSPKWRKILVAARR